MRVAIGLRRCATVFSVVVVPFLVLCYSTSAIGQSGEIRQQVTKPARSKPGGPVALSAHPVVSSRIYWFAINTAGYGSAPISMISSNATGAQMDSAGNYYVLSTPTGGFNISSWNACPTTNSSQYVLALGGDAGNGQDNPNIAMVGVISVTCGNGWYMHLSEAGTVAAAYGLGTFASFGTNSFATDTNSSAALQAGVAYANSLYNTNTGSTSSGNVWQSTLNTLGSMLADCSATPSTCSSLFAAATPPGGVIPANEFQAVLNIALNPTLDLSGPFSAIPSPAPISPILSSYPANWTIPGSSIHIAAITPVPAPVGTTITLGGSGFGTSQGSGSIVIGGIQAGVSSWSDSAINIAVPSGVASNGYVQVFQSGQASNQFPFSVGPISTPYITRLSFTRGPTEMGFVVVGGNFGSFQGASKVQMNGDDLIVRNWSAGSLIECTVAGTQCITVQIPSSLQAGGNVVVTVGGVASNGVGFTLETLGCDEPPPLPTP